MRILNVTQGSPEWLAARAQHNTASEAPAMMGVSKYQTRSELLAQKATGITPDVDSHKQALFDRGHESEAAARLIVEEMIGEDLFPATVVDDETGLLASLDGITMTETIVFEHKLWSESLAAQVRAGELEPHYFWQLEQELLVSKAEKVIFVCSDGTRDKFVSMEYFPVPGRAAQLVAGWKQFDADRAAYVPVQAAAAVVAKAVTALPAVSVQVNGTITVIDNFAAFEVALNDFIEHRLIRDPQTDQDFADLDLQIKAMKGAEAMLESSETQMLSQVEAVDQAKRTKDMLHKLTRDNRLMAEKLLSTRKEQIKGEIVATGITALREHIASLNTRLGKPYMPTVPADFAGAIKNKRTVDSLRESVNNELVRAKLAANEIADRIEINLRHLRENASEFTFLFADTAQLVLKPAEDLATLVSARITEHKAAEQKRLDEQREQIRREEQEKAEKAAAEKTAREAEEARQAAELAKPAPLAAPAPAATTDGPLFAPVTASQSSPVGNVLPMTRTVSAPAPATEHPSVKLGTINDRLGFSMTADFVTQTLGIAATRERGAVLFRPSDVDRIYDALIDRINQARQPMAA